MFDRITFSPDIMGGRACIRGMRIPVSVLVGQIAHGAPFEEILDVVKKGNTSTSYVLKEERENQKPSQPTKPKESREPIFLALVMVPEPEKNKKEKRKEK